MNSPELPFTRQTPAEFTAALGALTTPVVHNVIHTFYDHVPQDEVNRAVDIMRRLGDLPGILGWVVAQSVDTRKGRTMFELGVFADGQALLDFRAHPRHKEFTDLNLTDWVIADFPAAYSPGLLVPPLPETTESGLAVVTANITAPAQLLPEQT